MSYELERSCLLDILIIKTGISDVLNFCIKILSTSRGSWLRMLSILSLVSMVLTSVSIPQSNSRKMLTEFSEESETMRLTSLMVARISSTGRVISRSTSSGVELGYGMLMETKGASSSGKNSRGRSLEEIKPITTKDKNIIRVITGRRSEKSVIFMVFYLLNCRQQESRLRSGELKP